MGKKGGGQKSPHQQNFSVLGWGWVCVVVGRGDRKTGKKDAGLG